MGGTAGGIADGRAMAAAFCLGAEAVQMGSRFVATVESSAHENFKQAILKANSSSTMLMMKNVVPVRLLKNKFYEEIKALEDRCATTDELVQHLGHGRAKEGMLDGNLEQGELEIGQVAALIKDSPTVKVLVDRILREFESSKARL